MNLYDFTVRDTNGYNVQLNKYKNKVVLVVNTAIKCGLTPQFEGLQKIYDALKDKGFEILDFPCNQFGEQAPGTDEEINRFCTLNYRTSFPRFAKIDVNGANEIPLYKWLKSQAKDLDDTKIEWNFAKFLLDKNGNVFKRYPSTTKPEDLLKDINGLLG
ncbi:MAG: glutathione peroxidase [Fusobacteriaceae bacterium]|jgi:glutathione peroxidase|nr:glutathione peroxidase [Fusobacteriaceae bacterium]